MIMLIIMISKKKHFYNSLIDLKSLPITLNPLLLTFLTTKIKHLFLLTKLLYKRVIQDLRRITQQTLRKPLIMLGLIRGLILMLVWDKGIRMLLLWLWFTRTGFHFGEVEFEVLVVLLLGLLEVLDFLWWLLL